MLVERMSGAAYTLLDMTDALRIAEDIAISIAARLLLTRALQCQGLSPVLYKKVALIAETAESFPRALVAICILDSLESVRKVLPMDERDW